MERIHPRDVLHLGHRRLAKRRVRGRGDEERGRHAVRRVPHLVLGRYHQARWRRVDLRHPLLQEGAFVVDTIPYYSDSALGTDLTAEADWKR
ncbi:hypothetical protein BD410DRAFT_463399 [Rickenella mellea]|uniref:Uncharacterized protein n=1 Tax=Rickenella mellea TaxID=50990 RepID=A0A4Y7PUF5_9AGAM|nr:hypothetical protein BD410DRAFT_463399 [Rickenella mellea]